MKISILSLDGMSTNKLIQVTVGLQFPNEVQSVRALGLLGVEHQSDSGGDCNHDVGPLLIPVQPTLVPIEIIFRYS